MRRKQVPDTPLTAADLADAVGRMTRIAAAMGMRPVPWLVHPPALACPHLLAIARARSAMARGR
jgi:hypothetical protein